jgi:hypothetical protein
MLMKPKQIRLVTHDVVDNKMVGHKRLAGLSCVDEHRKGRGRLVVQGLRNRRETTCNRSLRLL